MFLLKAIKNLFSSKVYLEQSETVRVLIVKIDILSMLGSGYPTALNHN